MENPNPVAQLRIANITAAIWKNEAHNGARYNVTFQRSFKEGKRWKNADSFGPGDLLAISKLADQAHTGISSSKSKNGVIGKKTRPEGGFVTPISS